jgi:hypothetical protein
MGVVISTYASMYCVEDTVLAPYRRNSAPIDIAREWFERGRADYATIPASFDF